MVHPIGTCAECGLDGRVLKYNRNTTCWTYSCQLAAALEVAKRRAGGGADATLFRLPEFCVNIDKVLGVRDCPDQLSRMQRRNTPFEVEDAEIAYKIQGTFAESTIDAGCTDIRWVDLQDLVHNLNDAQLKLLDVYEKALSKRMVTARKKLRKNP